MEGIMFMFQDDIFNEKKNNGIWIRRSENGVFFPCHFNCNECEYTKECHTLHCDGECEECKSQRVCTLKTEPDSSTEEKIHEIQLQIFKLKEELYLHKTDNIQDMNLYNKSFVENELLECYEKLYSYLNKE